MLQKLILLALFWPLSSGAEPLRLGALLDLTKVYAPQGQAYLRGIELAVEEINKQAPRSIEYFVEDTGFDAKNAVTGAQRLIVEKKVASLFTMSATEHKAVALMASKLKILSIALWDSSPDIESLGDYSFGFGPWTPGTGEETAKFALTRLQLKNAYIVTQQDEWSEAAGNYFKESFEKLGGQVVRFENLAAHSADFRSTVAKIGRSDADLVFCPMASNISQFIKQARQQKLSQKLITADVLTNEEISNAQGAAEGVYQLEADAPDSKRAISLFDRYLERYGKEAEQKQFVSWGYDAVIVLYDSWNRAKQIPGKPLSDAVRETKDLEVSSGIVSVSAKGSMPKFHVPHQVQQGRLITLK